MPADLDALIARPRVMTIVLHRDMTPAQLAEAERKLKILNKMAEALRAKKGQSDA